MTALEKTGFEDYSKNDFLTFGFLLQSVTLGYSGAGGNWLISSCKTSLSTWFKHDPPNFLVSSLALPNKEVYVDD